jgi:hypothetical protein
VKGWTGNGETMGVAHARRAVVGRPHGTGTARKKGSKAGKSLSKAACTTIEGSGARITTSLLQRMLEGDSQSAKLLVALAEGPREQEEAATKPMFHSWASELAGEPQWVDEGMEGLGETGFGGRERKTEQFT